MTARERLCYATGAHLMRLAYWVFWKGKKRPSSRLLGFTASPIEVDGKMRVRFSVITPANEIIVGFVPVNHDTLTAIAEAAKILKDEHDDDSLH